MLPVDGNVVRNMVSDFYLKTVTLVGYNPRTRKLPIDRNHALRVA